MLSFPAVARSDNVRASFFMLLSMAGFIVNDTFVKIATADMAVPQIMAVRGIMASLFLFALAWMRHALRPLRLAFQPTVLLRTLSDIAATLSYITALSQMPLANASAIFQALPLTVTLGAALFFGEPVGWRRWTAIFVGFLGVLLIIRPGAEGFTVYSVAVLASVVFAAMRDLVTRRMPRDIPTLFVSTVTAVAVMLAGFLLLPFSQWQPLGVPAVGLLAGAAGAIAVGYIFIVEAMRVGEIGFVAPFRYSILIYALLIGLVVFGELPEPLTLLGSGIVVASGIYTLYRERIRGRVAAAKTQVH